jgi:osmoprotectant transport system permease protein
VTLSGSTLPVAAARTGILSLRLHNPVLFVLFAAAAAAVLSSGFVSVAPNRLTSGQPLALFAAADGRLSAGIVALGSILLGSSLVPPRRALHWGAAILAGGLLVLVLAAAGQAAARLADGAPAVARITLGAGFWMLFTTAALALVDALQRAAAGPGARFAAAAALVAASATMAWFGLFDALSLVREYATRRDLFATAVLRHVVLVIAAVGPAVLIGFPLGVAAARRPRMQGPLFAALNLLQTVPSIALFGLLLVPLSALATAFPALATVGIGGIGMAPAVIALVLYALLPIVRNSLAGIAGVDPAIVDASRGMGMTQRQIFRSVELPLALPLLLAGLRIVTVQAVGLAVVAALIGAGGLGTFVFEGLGQYAADLVLLGALPAIGLALAADFLVQTLAALAARR